MATSFIDPSTGEELVISDCQGRDGLTWDGKRTWALSGNDLIQSDVINGELYRTTLPTTNAIGITFDGTEFIVMEDDGSGVLLLINFTPQGASRQSRKTGSDYFRLCFLNKHLYTIRRSQYVSVLSVGGTVVKDDIYDSGSSSASGIATDGKYLYLSDPDTRTIHKITAEGQRVSFITPSVNNPVSDLTFCGRYLALTV